MGRLTLNVLLSFAQFEREVTGERIRDKIAASKRRGLWVGGMVPLGYRVESRKIVVVDEEAETVRLLFQRYLELGSLGKLLVELRERGVVTKRLVRDGVLVRGGIPFARGSLSHLLHNRFYIGEITFKGEVHAAEHPAILDRALFEAVRTKLAARVPLRRKPRRPSGALLMGKLFDERGHLMTPTHANKGGVRYRYYISRAIIEGQPRDAGPVSRVSAPAIETAILEALRERLRDEASDGDLVAAVRRITIGPDAIRISLTDAAPDVSGDLVLSWTRKSSRPHREVIAVAGRPGPVRPMRSETRVTLIAAIARARRWQGEILSGHVAGSDAIAIRAGCSRRQVNATLSLAHLAPDLVEAAIAGRLPHGITLRALTDLPIAWSEQRRTLGIASGRSL